MITMNDINTHQLPGAPKGFEHINRYWDAQKNCFAAKITPGEYYVSFNHEIITTILGSCVSACVWDRTARVGGMNHFMLPQADRRTIEAWGKTPVGSAARYGNVAMERLINAVLVNGGRRSSLQVKIFGGARVLDIDSEIGRTNIDFVLDYLRIEGFPPRAVDVGGIFARKVIFNPQSGQVLVKRLQQTHNRTLQQREKVYKKQVDKEVVRGEVTLFSD
jgi:chemotaxis protein CheD